MQAQNDNEALVSRVAEAKRNKDAALLNVATSGVTDETMAALKDAGDALKAAEAALLAARQTEVASTCEVEFIAAGKGAKTCSVQIGTTIDEVLSELGWKVGVYQLLDARGNLTPIDGAWRIPAGQSRVMVQQAVVGG